LHLRSVQQGGHSPEKPGKVREFENGQGKVEKIGKVMENVFLYA